MTEEKHILQTAEKRPRVLLIFYSFSGQTMGLLHRLTDGLKENNIEVVQERLRPVEQPRFPIGNIPSTIWMMLYTFFRRRLPIRELSQETEGLFDLILLAGPTWSYNPSGPVLSLLDRDGRRLFENNQVIPLISCRGYWRMHWYGLRRLLNRCGAVVPNRIIFSHPNKEPWRTIGVFLKLAGKNPERSKWIGKYYTRYGHSRAQRDEAYRFGLQIGEALQRKSCLGDINFSTPLSLPNSNQEY
jgi:hypothetical protein